jgi:hypothetical protein
MKSDAASDSTLSALDRLHRRIDLEASRLERRHADRLTCRSGCSACCLDGLTVRAIEADLIRREHPELLADAEPHAPGACAFLDGEGACRIYADRPSVCRSQGLPLRMFFEDENDEIVEHRDICPLNLDGGPPLEELGEEEFWLIGPVELELAELERSSTSAEPQRVALRSLFEK